MFNKVITKYIPSMCSFFLVSRSSSSVNKLLKGGLHLVNRSFRGSGPWFFQRITVSPWGGDKEGANPPPDRKDTDLAVVEDDSEELGYSDELRQIDL